MQGLSSLLRRISRATEGIFILTAGSSFASFRQAALQPAWDVKSIMERSFLAWLLRTDPAVAALGGEHTFSVLEYMEGAVKSFDLQETVDFATEVVETFVKSCVFLPANHALPAWFRKSSATQDVTARRLQDDKHLPDRDCRGDGQCSAISAAYGACELWPALCD